ncbi:MAG: hypothetical protein ACT6U0_08685 [Shinella sp.]|uniref:hypothetical protein n=1 Tax=Shinella sp. TaxID=1870904 RepID=UPI0040363381
MTESSNKPTSDDLVLKPDVLVHVASATAEARLVLGNLPLYSTEQLLGFVDYLGGAAQACLLAAEDPAAFPTKVALALGLECCDLAETILQKVASRRLFQKGDQDIPLITRHHTPIVHISRQIQWLATGKPDLDLPFPGQRQDLWFCYFRSFESVRRYQIVNDYRGGREEFFSIGHEPAANSLEGTLHRAVAYRVTTRTLAGPHDLLGMPQVAYQISWSDSPSRWQDLVETLMAGSDGAFLLPFDGPSTVWEMSYLAERCRSKVVVVVSLPARYDEKAPTYHALCVKEYAKHGVQMPAYESGGSFIVTKDGAFEQMPFSAVFDSRLLESILQNLPTSCGR